MRTPLDSVSHPWETSSTGDAADTSPLELSCLQQQLNECREMPGHVLALHCMGQVLHRYLQAHLVSTLALAAILVFLLT